MKIRTGFVSNSSSSSFLIVGTNMGQEKQLFEKCVKKTRGCKHPATEEEYCAKCGEPMWIFNEDDGVFSYGVFHSHDLTFIGRYPDDVYYAGVDAEKDLEGGKTVQEIRQRFISIAKKLGVEVPEKAVKLHFGEQSSE